MDIPVGFRFRPTPEELVNRFLKKRRLDPAFPDYTIREVNIYEHHPCELPGLSFLSDEKVWYFFCVLHQKYAKSGRAKRTAKGGSWKITSRDSEVKTEHTNKLIGFKKTLVFYKGSGFGKENKTNWVMHEYHAYHEDHHHNKKPVLKHEVVVCRIKRKPDKNPERSSTLDEGQPSDSLVYDSRSDIAEDIVLKTKPDQVLQNHYSPSSSTNYMESTNLMQVESQPLPIHHILHVTKNQVRTLRNLNYYQNNTNFRMKKISLQKKFLQRKNFSYQKKQHLSSNMENSVAKDVSSEVEPLVPAEWDLQSPISCSFSDDSYVCNAPLDSERDDDFWNLEDSELFGEETGHDSRQGSLFL
uniref:NAC transcription factor 25 n=1 Tax=Litchi chinensis TaxID=151069 RepID=A0A8K1HZS7_LITCN|nr:NAC transcription factor 25 [Litchi chinensis]